jgi:hypothetical protein
MFEVVPWIDTSLDFIPWMSTETMVMSYVCPPFKPTVSYVIWTVEPFKVPFTYISYSCIGAGLLILLSHVSLNWKLDNWVEVGLVIIKLRLHLFRRFTKLPGCSTLKGSSILFFLL